MLRKEPFALPGPRHCRPPVRPRPHHPIRATQSRLLRPRLWTTNSHTAIAMGIGDSSSHDGAALCVLYGGRDHAQDEEICERASSTAEATASQLTRIPEPGQHFYPGLWLGKFLISYTPINIYASILAYVQVIVYIWTWMVWKSEIGFRCECVPVCVRLCVSVSLMHL